MDPDPQPPILRFGPFELDSEAGELRRDGRPVKLAQQPLAALALLAEHAGEVVSREELRRHLWGDETFVDFERGLNFCILQIRRALGDDARAPRWVETLPRRGYRLRGGAETEAEEALGAARRRRVLAPAMLGALLGGVLAAGLAVAWMLRDSSGELESTTPAPAERLLLAVLPFDNLSGDPDQDFFSAGLTEEVIAQLGGLDPERLGVIARTSVERYAASDLGAGAIGRELGVAYLLEGSVRRDEGHVRITAQLIQAADETHLWSESYDRNQWGALVVQREVAAAVARALRLELLGGRVSYEGLPDRAGSHVPEAHEAYLKGRYLTRRGSAEDLERSLGPFREAARLDPAFALPRVALAETWLRLVMAGARTPHEAAGPAREHAEAALALAPDLAEAHAARGRVALWLEWDAEAAGRGLRRALELNPSLAAARHDLGWHLLALGRPEEGLAEVERARALDPLSVEAEQNRAWAYLQARRYGEALAQCRRTLELEPDLEEAAFCIERAHLLRGDTAEALSAMRARLGEPSAEESETAEDAAEALAALQRRSLARLLALAEAGDPRSRQLAVLSALLGEPDAAFRWLERAFEARSLSLVLLATDPLFDPLRGDPRFADLVRRVGYSEES